MPRDEYMRNAILTWLTSLGGDAHGIRWIVKKTRYVDDEFVRRFPHLRGIVVLGTETYNIQTIENLQL